MAPRRNELILSEKMDPLYRGDSPIKDTLQSTACIRNTEISLYIIREKDLVFFVVWRKERDCYNCHTKKGFQH